MKLYGSSGQEYEIEDKPSLGSGGEGGVYSVRGYSDKVIKIYHNGVPTEELEQKLQLMTDNPPSAPVLNQVAWPLDVIYDSNHSFCGFMMPRLSIDVDLGEIYTYPPETNVTYKQRLIIGQNICAVISEIHKAGYIFGDFNPRNIGVDTKTGRVAFLDTDSYHIVIDAQANKAYRCNVCASGYAAPELLEKCAKHIAAHPEDKKSVYANTPLDTFTKETDYFALAIHLFRLMMNGYSPFSGIEEKGGKSSPGVGDKAVLEDSYCFKKGYKTISPAVPSIDQIPPQIADLFTRAFIAGRTDPKQRPDAFEWYKALEQYENNLVTCTVNPAHMYMSTLKKCPWCEADERYEKATKPPLLQKQFATPIVPNTPSANKSNVGATTPVKPPLQNIGTGGSTYKPTSKGARTRNFFFIILSQRKWIVATVVIIALILAMRGCINDGHEEVIDHSYATEEAKELNLLNIEKITKKTIKAGKVSYKQYKGRIRSDYQKDVYKFTPKRTDRYTFKLSGIHNDGFMMLGIYNSKGEEVNASGMYNGEELSIDRLKKGKKYKIIVKSGNVKGPYRLTIYKPKKIKDVTRITAVSDSISYPGQDNRYSITAPRDGMYRFEFSEIHDEKRLGLFVYNALGEELDSGYYRNGDGITIELEENKKYVIHVKENGGATPYVLSIGKPKKVRDISEYDGVEDSTEYADQGNIYTFTPKEDAVYYFSFTDMLAVTSVKISIYNRLGERVRMYYRNPRETFYLATLENKQWVKTRDLDPGETYIIYVEQSYDYTPYIMIVGVETDN